MNWFRFNLWWRMALVAMVLGVLLAPVAVGGQQLRLTAPFLSVAVDRGDEVKLPLTVENLGETPRTIDISIPSAPEGWEVVVERDFPRLEVRRIYLEAKDPTGEETGNKAELQFRAIPPARVAPGDYSFTIRATMGGGASASLEITVAVGGDEAAGGVTVESKFQVLPAPSGSSFQFKVDVRNDTGEDLTFELLSVAPEGWQVGFEPEFERMQVSTISIQSGRTQGLKVTAVPPPRVEADTYPIQVAVRAGEEQAELELQAVVTGTYDLVLGTTTGRLNTKVTAGQPAPFTLVAGNSGSAPLTDINFFAAKPTGWEVTFSPDRLDTLATQEPREVNLQITAPAKAIPGDYSLTISASSAQAGDEVELRVTVLATTVWGWVGVVVVVVVVASLIGLFMRQGRR